jgi:hypothetical protein
MSGAPYRHTQIGYTLMAVMAGAFGVAIAACAWSDFVAGAWLVAGLGVLALLNFATLTVELRAGEILCSFGPGIVRCRIPVARVEAVAVVDNSWFHGWGIRLTSHGWLWSVSGLRGVGLQLRGGRSFRIGSEEPEALAEAVRSAMSGEIS